jgi:hypothetical protein
VYVEVPGERGVHLLVGAADVVVHLGAAEPGPEDMWTAGVPRITTAARPGDDTLEVRVVPAVVTPLLLAEHLLDMSELGEPGPTRPPAGGTGPDVSEWADRLLGRIGDRR